MLLQKSKDPDFKPKVLVRGSGSGNNADKVLEEAVPISNSFQALTDDAMNEEYESSIWRFGMMWMNLWKLEFTPQKK